MIKLEDIHPKGFYVYVDSENNKQFYIQIDSIDNNGEIHFTKVVSVEYKENFNKTKEPLKLSLKQIKSIRKMKKKELAIFDDILFPDNLN